MLGLLPPSLDAPNLALQDLTLALQFTRDLVGSLGGDGNKITIAGQSSGASMIRGGSMAGLRLRARVTLVHQPSSRRLPPEAYFVGRSCSRIRW